MVNSNVDEVDAKQNETESRENDASEHENSLTVLKEESFEEESLNKVIITESNNEGNRNYNVNVSVINKDAVINIGIDETGSAPKYNVRRQTRPPSNPRTLLTRYLWRQGYDRRQMQQLQGKEGYLQQWFLLQGFPQQKEHVLFQHNHFQKQKFENFGAGYDEAFPERLDYDPKSRNSFVLIVMTMVFIMLVVTATFNAYVLITPKLKKFFVDAGLLVLVPSMTGLLICNYAMMCSPCARSPPCSYVLLMITTCCMSFMAALITSYYRTRIVLLATIATTVIVVVCIMLACTSFDFTKWSLFIVVVGTALSVISILVVILMKVSSIYVKPLHLGVLIVSVIVQSVVFVIELQMVLGGRTIELAEDDYALAAFMLYTSIVDVFIKMVQILGLMED